MHHNVNCMTSYTYVHYFNNQAKLLNFHFFSETGESWEWWKDPFPIRNIFIRYAHASGLVSYACKWRYALF